MDTDWGLVLTGEMLAFGLLGKAFYAYPERVWLQSLVDEDVFAEAPSASGQPQVQTALALLQGWTKKQQGGISDEAFDAVQADYTRLFIGPGQVLAPPWESVHFSEERLTFQAETLQVRAWYQRFGLVVEKLYSEPDDHIGLEYEFVAHLAKQGLSALDCQDPADLNALLDAQRAFLSEHVLRWAPAWCTSVVEQAHTDWYRGLATLAQGVLAETAEVLQIPIPQKGK